MTRDEIIDGILNQMEFSKHYSFETLWHHAHKAINLEAEQMRICKSVMITNRLIQDITALACGITIEGQQIKESGGWRKHLIDQKPKTNILGLTTTWTTILASVATVGTLLILLHQSDQSDKLNTIEKENKQLKVKANTFEREKDSLLHLLRTKELVILKLDSLNKGIAKKKSLPKTAKPKS